MESTARTLGAALLALTLAACGRSEAPAPHAMSTAERSTVVVDGPARFSVLTPTLIRLEYADDGAFEDRPTQTVIQRRLPVPDYSTAIEDGDRVIRTEKLTLRYRLGSGAFSADNLSVELQAGAETVRAQPGWTPESNPPPLGGWRRSLDNEQDPQPLNPGLLSRAGWHLLNDSATVLLTDTPPGFAVRPARGGTYQDGYFFGYGLDYPQALADLRAITGAAPLLPRKALGVWFSRYWAYSETELRELVARFRTEQIPFDVFSVDTDWKRMHSAVGCVFFSAIAGARPGDPCSWNGWDWNLDQFPDPAGFIAWMHEQGIEVGLNIHPSISSRDPRYADTVAIAGPLSPDASLPPCGLYQADPTSPLCYVFDWTKAEQLEAYFALHQPIAYGMDFWWLDWCCDGASAEAPGLSADTWINAHYHQDHIARGSRWPAFSRIGSSFQEGKAGVANGGNGALAEHRHTLHFTGDACGTWQMLAYQAEMTAAEGAAIGMPYVSHDIGSFLGPPIAGGVCNGTAGRTPRLPEDMYVRWLQFGTFQPLDRLHSHHGDRLPWEYPGAPQTIVTEFLRLRGRLVPYLYTLSREAHDTGLPMVRALYLQWPELDAAYQHPTQYTLGRDLLIAAVTTPGDPAVLDLWIPPGEWTDYFTGETFTGPQTISYSVPLARYPVFLRAGAILPTQPDLPTTPITSPDKLTLDLVPGADGEFELYDDEGRGFGYTDGDYAWTRIRSQTRPTGCQQLEIEPMRGNFPGQPAVRQWTLRWRGIDAPALVSAPDGTTSAYDAARRTLTVETGPRSTRIAITVKAGPAGC